MHMKGFREAQPTFNETRVQISPQASNDLIMTCHITFEQNQKFLSANCERLWGSSYALLTSSSDQRSSQYVPHPE